MLQTAVVNFRDVFHDKAVCVSTLRSVICLALNSLLNLKEPEGQLVRYLTGLQLWHWWLGCPPPFQCRKTVLTPMGGEGVVLLWALPQIIHKHWQGTTSTRPEARALYTQPSPGSWQIQQRTLRPRQTLTQIWQRNKGVRRYLENSKKGKELKCDTNRTYLGAISKSTIVFHDYNMFGNLMKARMYLTLTPLS